MRLEFRFIYTGIRVKNMEVSLKFYTDVLGMVIAEPLQAALPTKGTEGLSRLVGREGLS